MVPIVDKGRLRIVALAIFCGALIVWNGPDLRYAEHRSMALLFLTCGLSLALFLELMAREVALEWVLAGIGGVMAAAGVGLGSFSFFFFSLSHGYAPFPAA